MQNTALSCLIMKLFLKFLDKLIEGSFLHADVIVFMWLEWKQSLTKHALSHCDESEALWLVHFSQHIAGAKTLILIIPVFPQCVNPG